MEHLFLKMKGFAVKDRIQTGEQYGLMMAKDHPLLGKLNDAITAMKQDGTTAAIHKNGSVRNLQPVPRQSPSCRSRSRNLLTLVTDGPHLQDRPIFDRYFSD